MIICEEMHYAGAPGGVFASLFTCGIAVPHMIASGDQRLIDTLRAAHAARRAIGIAGHHRTRRRLRRRAPAPRRAVRDGDDYIVNGAKTYITSGVRADFVVTAVAHRRPWRRGCLAARGRQGHAGFEVTRKLDKMGWRSSDTAELSFTDVRVPAANLVGAENTGFAQIAAAFVSERVGLAAQAYASAQRCLDLTVEWCRDRETFGKPLISRQSVQNTLAEMARRIDVARVYTRNVVERQLAGETNLIAEVCFAKNTAVEAGEWVANQAVQLFGGMGYMAESEVERHYRDMRILGIGGGTTEILTALAAKTLGIPVMTALASTLDPRSPAYAEAAEAMLAKLAELDAEHAKALAGGGEKYVDRHHDRGKLTAARAHRAAARPRLAVPRAVARWPPGAPTSPSAPAWSPASAWSRASSA